MSKRASTPLEAVKSIRSGDHVFIHTASATPRCLVDAMVQRADELRDVEIYQMHTEGEAKYAEKQYKDSFKVNCMFVGGNMRKAIAEGRASFIPCFFSEVPLMFRRGVIPMS